MTYKTNCNDIIVIGLGGHARFVIATLLKSHISIKGLISVESEYDDKEKILNMEIIGSLSDLSLLFDDGFKNIFLAIGDNKLREKLFNQYLKCGFLFPTLVHPESSIDSSAVIGIGNIIGPRAVIGANVNIGNNNIINTSSVIEHESVINNNSHIAPGSVICGRVKIGNQVLVGANSTLIENIIIADNTIIGAGSTVVKSIEHKNGTFVGSPAKIIKL